VLCTYLFTPELIAANPMPQIGRPKVAKTLPKSLPASSVTALLSAMQDDPEPRRRSDWIERDRALILTALLAGSRADELIGANVGDIRRTDDGAVIHVRGKGGKDRRIPVESPMIRVIEGYLDSRVARFPATAKKRSPSPKPPGSPTLPCAKHPRAHGLRARHVTSPAAAVLDAL
jgi:site-specific recombinase XerD